MPAGVNPSPRLIPQRLMATWRQGQGMEWEYSRVREIALPYRPYQVIGVRVICAT